jgi:electron transport complex protein RnfC
MFFKGLKFSKKIRQTEQIKIISLINAASSTITPQKTNSAEIDDPILKNAKKYKTGSVIVRCADADPHILTQKAVTENLEQFADDLKTAIKAVKQITGKTDVIFATDKTDTNSPVIKFAKKNGYKTVAVNPFNYPSFMDLFLIKKITGEECCYNSQNLLNCGHMVFDISKMAETGQVINTGHKNPDKIITVIWPDGKKVVTVPSDMTILKLTEKLKIKGPLKRVIMGGPLNGTATYTILQPIPKNITAITIINDNRIFYKNLPCINCGRCSAVCPAGLLPGLLSRYIEYDKYENAQKAGVQYCAECGCCAITCPAGRSLVQYMQLGKSMINKNETC